MLSVNIIIFLVTKTDQVSSRKINFVYSFGYFYFSLDSSKRTEEFDNIDDFFILHSGKRSLPQSPLLKEFKVNEYVPSDNFNIFDNDKVENVYKIDNEIVVDPIITSNDSPKEKRKTNRKRISPLKFWRNEKVVYGRKASSRNQIIYVFRISQYCRYNQKTNRDY